ncbi:Regulatory protein Cgi121 [ANME-1 cluster archaeon GoMg1]|nr:Regulatory protein Cgi121 [ANME-1 cluster archaeon GoMg1]
MFDSQKQARELNCKLIAGKVRVSNVDDFLAVLKTIAHKYDVTIQAMNAELIAGEEHIKSAVKKALRAVERNRNITNDLSLEILLYAAGRRQIERALAMGVSKSEGENAKTVAIVIVDTYTSASGGKDLDMVAGEVKKATMMVEEPVQELELEHNEDKKEKLKQFFEISEDELKAVGESKLKQLVLERVAMLDVLK